MKKLIIGGVLGTVVGAGALFGVMQIPKVNDTLVLKDKEVVETPVDTESQEKIENLENTNTQLQENITSLNSQLSEAQNQIKTKDEDIATKTAEISQLTIEKNQLLAIKNELENKDIPALNDTIIELSTENASLKEELDTYKELVGKDISYIEIINGLNLELETTTNNLNTATAELEQLRVEKETLTTRVTELESALSIAQDKLSKYESLEQIDKYDISNFDGTWYKLGTFEDYFIIKDGVVTHNANEDTGVVQKLYNQMYLFMSGNSIAVELSDDGTQFTTADGTVYSMFYINTQEPTEYDNFNFSGEYSFDNEIVKINIDNSIEYIVDNVSYHGAYLYSSFVKNVGGNSIIVTDITATIQKDNESIIKQFRISNVNDLLIDKDTNNVFTRIVIFDGAVLMPSATDDVNAFIESVENGYKIVVVTQDYVTIPVGGSVSVVMSTGGNANATKCYALNNFVVDGTPTFYNPNSYPIRTKHFSFYMTNLRTTSQLFGGITKIGGITSSVSFIEQIGNGISYGRFNTTMKELIVSNENDEFNSVLANPVNDYINGSYTADTIQLDITTDTAVITLPEIESITASTYEILSQTDGYDIYQTVTITYIITELVEEVETEITHTVVIDLKNNNVVSSTLDNESIEFSKN